MAKRYELTDEQYEQVKELLPGKVGDSGRSGTDNRQISQRGDVGVAQRCPLARPA